MGVVHLDLFHLFEIPFVFHGDSIRRSCDICQQRISSLYCDTWLDMRLVVHRLCSTLFQVWFQNRRAKFRKSERLTQQKQPKEANGENGNNNNNSNSNSNGNGSNNSNRQNIKTESTEDKLDLGGFKSDNSPPPPASAPSSSSQQPPQQQQPQPPPGSATSAATGSDGAPPTSVHGPILDRSSIEALDISSSGGE